MRSLFGVLFLFGSILAPAPVAATTGGSEVIVPYASPGWRFATTEPDALPGFEAVAFDDADFADGEAMFGSPGGCANDEAIATPWAAGNDLLVRRTVALPDDGRQLRIGLSLVRTAEVFVNGQSITDGFITGDPDCPRRDRPLLIVPDDLIVRGGANVVAIRARAPTASDPQYTAPAVLDIEVRLVEAPINDDLADAVLIDSVPYEDSVGVEGATLEPGENAESNCGSMSASVWYRFKAPVADSYSFQVPGDGMNGQWIVARYVEDGLGGLTLLGCAGSGLMRPFRSEAGSEHLFQVGPYPSGSQIDAPVTFRIDRAPDLEPSFLVNPFIVEALVPASFSDQTYDPAGGQITTWSWEFGDGGTSTEGWPTHRFLASGTYDVTLTVQTDDGRSATTTKAITVHPYSGGPPVADFFVGYGQPYAGHVTYFVDQTFDPAGLPVVDWQWSFGDGSSGTGPNPSHVFAAAGDYTVDLRVTTEDDRSGTASRIVTVVMPPDPFASFGLYTPNPTTAAPVAFFDSSYDSIGRPIVGWAWQFGDGATSTEQAPSHRYTVIGDYSVELTITTDDGRSASTSLVVSVAVPPDPIAAFGWSPYDPSIVDTVQFYDGSYDPASAGVVAWQWSFGDGATDSAAYPTHRFEANGTYTVTLTITTADGRTAVATNSVTVSTHDVAIKSLTAPRSASAGQTKAVHVDLVNRRTTETVDVALYRSTTNGSVLVGTQSIEVRAGRATRASFDVTFTAADALVGKVTFRAYVTLVGARDAIPADNEAISGPTKVTR